MAPRFGLVLCCVIVAVAEWSATPAPTVATTATVEAGARPLLLVSNSSAHEVSFVDPTAGVVARVEVGAAPWGIALAADHRAYVATAEGVAIVDTQARRRLALVPCQADVGAATLKTRALSVAPLGFGGFDKPHGAALGPDGHLLLPFQGHVLLDLDPVSGESTTVPLTANTHQHGAAIAPDGHRLLIVGAGPAGGATGGPSLTVLDLATSDGTVIPLSRPHEDVAVDPTGRWSDLTGGYTFAGGGWDGLTVVDLEDGTAVELPVPDRPLAVAVAVR